MTDQKSYWDTFFSKGTANGFSTDVLRRSP
jgi:hypothetical protein